MAHNISDQITIESAQEDFPLIVLDRDISNKYVYHVEVDNEHGGYLATEYLIEKGLRNIAYIGGPQDSNDNKKRLKGYMEALKNHNLTAYSNLNSIGNFTREGGYKATKLLIARGELPEGGIFYGNDEMAIGGLQAFRDHQIKVPEEISVIGFDDIQLSEYVSPPLTTIKQPKYEAGALAVDLIFQLIEGKQINQKYTLSTELVVRESVRK